jgi:putative ABC transport system permease protein
VVGVAKDARYREWGALRLDIYVPMRQKAQFRTDFVIRTSVDPLTVAPAVRQAIYSIDPDQPLTEVTTLDKAVASVLARPRFNLLLLSIFAGLSLLLAAIGVYGVVAYSVTQRTREIGIRMALGAQAAGVTRLIVTDALASIGAGVVAGLVLALVFSTFLRGLLYGVSPTDPLTFASIAVLLSAVGLLASFIPARRAARVDPIVALRYE